MVEVLSASSVAPTLLLERQGMFKRDEALAFTSLANPKPPLNKDFLFSRMKGNHWPMGVEFLNTRLKNIHESQLHSDRSKGPLAGALDNFEFLESDYYNKSVQDPLVNGPVALCEETVIDGTINKKEIYLQWRGVVPYEYKEERSRKRRFWAFIRREEIPRFVRLQQGLMIRVGSEERPLTRQLFAEMWEKDEHRELLSKFGRLTRGEIQRKILNGQARK
jgi:hypothetical protein